MTSIQLPNSYTLLDSLYTRMGNGDSVTIVCYGNSITYGVLPDGTQAGETYPMAFERQLRAHYGNPNIRVVNEGHGGWTAEVAAGGLDTLVLPHQPHLVTIIFGINDLYQEKGLGNYAQHITDMVGRLKAEGIAVLVLSPTPLFNKENKSLLEYCATASEIAETQGVAFFNMHHAMVGRVYATTDDVMTIMPDGVHYTSEGYPLIGDALMEYWLGR